MPAFAGETFLILARHRRVKLDHRLAALYRSVRAASDDRATLQKALPRVRAFQPLDADAARREVQVADGMRRLHRRNDAEAGKSRNVRGGNDLRMLDAPARLADFALAGRHCV